MTAGLPASTPKRELALSAPSKDKPLDNRSAALAARGARILAGALEPKTYCIDYSLSESEQRLMDGNR